MDIKISDKERIEGQLMTLEVAGRRIESLEGLVQSLENDYQNAMKPVRGIATAPQSEWVSIDDFNPTESCYVHAYCNDIVNGWVELLHVYVCPEYGNHTIETLDGEDYPAIVTHVQKVNKPEPPK